MLFDLEGVVSDMLWNLECLFLLAEQSHFLLAEQFQFTVVPNVMKLLVFVGWKPGKHQNFALEIVDSTPRLLWNFACFCWMKLHFGDSSMCNEIVMKNSMFGLLAFLNFWS